MKKITFPISYELGEIIKTSSKILKVIGYEYVPTRALRYVLIHEKDGDAAWVYLYDFEIELLKEDNGNRNGKVGKGKVDK